MTGFTVHVCGAVVPNKKSLVFRTLVKVRNRKIIFSFLNQNICLGYSKNRLNETVLLSTHNIC